jgi:hypothetical protein
VEYSLRLGRYFEDVPGALAAAGYDIITDEPAIRYEEDPAWRDLRQSGYLDLSAQARKEVCSYVRFRSQSEKSR